MPEEKSRAEIIQLKDQVREANASSLLQRQSAEETGAVRHRCREAGIVPFPEKLKMVVVQIRFGRLVAEAGTTKEELLPEEMPVQMETLDFIRVTLNRAEDTTCRVNVIPEASKHENV